MGIRTRLSTNPAMTLGGLEEGVTPLEMAYAYSTIANKGLRVSGTMAPENNAPVGIDKVVGDGFEVRNRKRTRRVFDEQTGQTAQDMLSLVVSSGTGKAAQVSGEDIWGKTGTTENYGDAWFVGSNGELTVAVWVGYADKLIPMEYEFGGSPVAGGTYPAEIFASFMGSWVGIREAREAASGKTEDDSDEDDGGGTALPAVPVAPSAVPPAEQQAAPPAAAPETADGDARAAGAAGASAAAGARAGARAHPGRPRPRPRRRPAGRAAAWRRAPAAPAS